MVENRDMSWGCPLHSLLMWQLLHFPTVDNVIPFLQSPSSLKFKSGSSVSSLGRSFSDFDPDSYPAHSRSPEHVPLLLVDHFLKILSILFLQFISSFSCFNALLSLCFYNLL